MSHRMPSYLFDIMPDRMSEYVAEAYLSDRMPEYMSELTDR